VVDIEELVALQGVDLQLDALNRRLGKLDVQLEEPVAMLALADEIVVQEAHLKEVRTARTTVEAEAEAARLKIETEDKKLYGGTITEARELKHLQEEIFALRRALKGIEDQLLARLDEEEHETEALDYLNKLRDGSNAGWHEHSSRLQAEHQEIESEVKIILANVDEHRSHLGNEELSVYDSHRQRQSVAVAAAVGGVCGACRLSLPTTILNRARRATEPVPCPSCDCIVYLR
jgi:predicted  nucleic acid-binding Zn-ribbon protein